MKIEPMKSRGLGDTIERVTTATGIKKIVDTVASALDTDCGCSKRKELLNEMFPYKETEKQNNNGTKTTST